MHVTFCVASKGLILSKFDISILFKVFLFIIAEIKILVESSDKAIPLRNRNITVKQSIICVFYILCVYLGNYHKISLNIYRYFHKDIDIFIVIDIDRKNLI